jgi:hypothetical protein
MSTSNAIDLSAYLPSSPPEHPTSTWHSVGSEDRLRYTRKTTHVVAHAVKSMACIAFGTLTNILVGLTPGTELVAPAQAQVVPKSLEQGGPDAALKQRKNAWTVGVAGGQRSGTYMTFADELAQVLDDGDNLRVIPIVTYGAASNLDDLLYLRQVDVVVTQSDVFEYFRTQRKTPISIRESITSSACPYQKCTSSLAQTFGRSRSCKAKRSASARQGPLRP